MAPKYPQITGIKKAASVRMMAMMLASFVLSIIIHTSGQNTPDAENIYFVG
jgi:hypothetical protein